ncbi:hypothetical protein ROZALSC1DRAFT_28652 [Rozella allomycis CSF55]|uniref:RRM domain-containing protein n=1 Tax=Rozella allomycis (strain CSF55) TaxID=988480 RepID=A0A4P9YK35_ROZAC|nr:hypothetical protein ROZALSC1DRAFT_28652 [Rozella allomycis CSF55]
MDNVVNKKVSSPNELSNRRPSRIKLSDCKIDHATGDLISISALVIKNVPFAVERDTLLGVFDELNLPKPFALNYHTDGEGNFRGLAFANFTDPVHAAIVLEKLQGYEIQGRKIKVEPKKVPINTPEDKQTVAHLKPNLVSAAPIESRLDSIQAAMKVLQNNDLISSIALSSSLSRVERIEVMQLAEDMGLCHATENGPNGRFISVMRSENESRRSVVSVARPPPNLAPIGSNRRFSSSDLGFKGTTINFPGISLFEPLKELPKKPMTPGAVNKTQEVADALADVKF